jgi:hypothetical protein
MVWIRYQMAVSSPARCSRARVKASPRLVFTLARALRDQRGHDDRTFMAELGDLALHAIARRTAS